MLSRYELASLLTVVVIGALAGLLVASATARDITRPASSPMWQDALVRTQFSGTDIDLRTASGLTIVAPYAFETPTLSATRRGATLHRLATATNSVIDLVFVEGVYWTQVCVNRTTCAWAVVDTGSSHVVLATEACTTCDTRTGAISVPEDQHVVHADMWLHYGSQSIQADVALHSISIPGFDLDADMHRALLQDMHVDAARDAMIRRGNHIAGGATSAAETQVFATKLMSGDTAANILGLAPTAPGARVPAAIDALQPDARARAFGVLLGSTGGVLIPGPIPPAVLVAPGQRRFVSVPLRVPPHLATLPTQFFMVRLLNVLVGASLSCMRSIVTSASVGRMHAMFDTGSTFTFTSSKLQAPLQAAAMAVGTAAPYVALMLEDGVVFVLAPSNYVLTPQETGGGGAVSTLDTTAPFVDQLLGVQGFLVGCIAQRGIFMHYNISDAQLTFAAAHETMAA